MRKSILVIDTPSKCEECPLCKNYMKVHHADRREDTHEVHCIGIENIVMQEVPKESKPDWCPLENCD